MLLKNNNQIEEINPSNNMITTSKFSTEKEAKAVVLKGVGYPFNFALMEGSNLEISDKVLFEQYAREQWLGTIVKEGNYLFDQKIIPDFAFKVITVFPNNSVIGENTSIVIVEEEKQEEATSDIDGETGSEQAESMPASTHPKTGDPYQPLLWLFMLPGSMLAVGWLRSRM